MNEEEEEEMETVWLTRGTREELRKEANIRVG
jgi:hypothetical protein